MADYNLHGLNTRDFQHLIQAISRKRIGAGVTSFGDGRDGNRDLTFRGKMDYPSTAEGWDGYLVMGCKFNLQPTRDSQKDAAWVLTQLDVDLKKFLSKKRKLPKPDYYVLVTNVALSGVAESGGRDRITKKLEEYAKKIQLKGHAIWDYNDIRGFIDGDADIRSAYGHFITAGDVLTQIAECLKLQDPDFVEVMRLFLQKELIADMSAKLQSAVEDPELQISLASVFVDLPFARSAEDAVLASEKEEENLPRVVSSLLGAGSRILRRFTEEDDKTKQLPSFFEGGNFSRFVIVGGPGQGKSTLGQYLCQLYRASILYDQPKERLDEKVPPILKQLEKQRSHAGGLPIVKRFPLRIELRNFAHALDSNPKLTLREYIRNDISRLGSADLSMKDLQLWLRQYPWVLILDGLDEVPPSSNRGDVLREIESFRMDAASANADMMVIATTRPQSYSKEFSEELFLHLYLTPLSSKQALEYGKKLAEARCGAEDRRKEELFSSLEKACKNLATSRLMQSPLQITIMATLLEDMGEPPQQRYRLFHEYYRTIYKRETRRKLLRGILTERQKDIDTIHAQAGLLLHFAGEKTTTRTKQSRLEDVDSALSDDQFRELVRRRLVQIGIIEPTASEFLDRISNSALDRLVFLVRPRVGWVRFDITSFKEFMAAEAVMNGSDEAIRKRLEVIGPASYWRNVFLFTVGKCFLEREHLLDNLVSLCTGLNECDACRQILTDETAANAAKAVLWGARLALDIIADGTARQYPGYEVRFTRIALQLTRFPDAENCARLAAVFHDDLKEMFLETIRDHLGQTNFRAQLGGWFLLTSLADRDISWALQILEDKWPVDIEAQRVILLGRGLRNPSKWHLNKSLDLAPKLAPRRFLQQLHLQQKVNKAQIPTEFPAWRQLFQSLESLTPSCEVAVHSIWSDVASKAYLVPFRLDNKICQSFQQPDFIHRDWFPLLAAARFGANPSAKTLSIELNWLAENWEPNEKLWPYSLPWPISACLFRAKSNEDLLRFAKAAQDGLLGDTECWEAAEQRWIQVGLHDDDFLASENEALPIYPELSSKGFPFEISSCLIEDKFPLGQFPSLLEKIHEIPNSETSSWLAAMILNYFAFRRVEITITSPSFIRELIEIASKGPKLRRHPYWIENLINIMANSELNAEWVNFFDWLGREFSEISINTPMQGLADQLTYHFCADPNSRRGLLPIIAELAKAGCHCHLSSHVLNLAKTWDARAESTAIGLGFSKSEFSDSEIAASAKKLLQSNPPNNAAWGALRIASGSSLELAAKLALAFLSQLNDSSEFESDIADHSRRTLTEFLTNKPSRLQDHLVWKQLSLPEPL